MAVRAGQACSVDEVGWESFDIDLADRWVREGTALLGDRVARRRVALGWSQRTLAHYVGCDPSVISRLERGLLRGIRYKRFARIVAVLGGLDPAAPWPDWLRPMDEPNPYFARLASPAARQRRIADRARPRVASPVARPRRVADRARPRVAE